MKKIAFIILSVLAICGFNAGAQVIIEYPNPYYLYWDQPCEPTTFGEGDDIASVMADDSFIIISPFQFKRSEENTKRTILGVAIAPVNMDLEAYLPINRRPAPYAWTRTVFISIYKAEVGDSVFQLLKQQQFRIEEGQMPDVAMWFHNPEREGEDALPLYEFYFDTAVEVTGQFFVGVDWEESIGKFYLLQGARLVADNNTACYPHGYKMFIDRNTLTIDLYGAFKGNDYSYFHTKYVPDAEAEDYRLRSQAVFPIIEKPRYLTAEPAATEQDYRVSVSPNPATGRASVASEEGIRSVTLVDMAGRTALYKAFPSNPSSATLDVSQLAGGVYSMRVETAKGTATKKLVVQR